MIEQMGKKKVKSQKIYQLRLKSLNFHIYRLVLDQTAIVTILTHPFPQICIISS